MQGHSLCLGKYPGCQQASLPWSSYLDTGLGLGFPKLGRLYTFRPGGGWQSLSLVLG